MISINITLLTNIIQWHKDAFIKIDIPGFAPLFSLRLCAMCPLALMGSGAFLPVSTFRQQRFYAPTQKSVSIVVISDRL